MGYVCGLGCGITSGAWDGVCVWFGVWYNQWGLGWGMCGLGFGAGSTCCIGLEMVAHLFSVFYSMLYCVLTKRVLP